MISGAFHNYAGILCNLFVVIVFIIRSLVFASYIVTVKLSCKPAGCSCVTCYSVLLFQYGN